MRNINSNGLLLVVIPCSVRYMYGKINVGNMSEWHTIDVENGKPAQYLYFGTKLNNMDIKGITVINKLTPAGSP